MSENKYNEPWSAMPQSATPAVFSVGGYGVRAHDGTWVCETVPHQPKGCSEEANADRIVACVNACAGIADPADFVRRAIEAGVKP